MNVTNVEFPSRVSARAIAAGTLVTFACTGLLLCIMGGLGLWEMSATDIVRVSEGFWVCSMISWILSCYAGGYVASVCSRSSTIRTGVSHGLITWASTAVLGALFLVWARNRFYSGFIPGDMTNGMFWGMAIGDILALCAAGFGSYQGAADEARPSHRGERGDRELRRVA